VALRTRLVAIAVAAVIVIVGVPALWWWTHPAVFPDMHGIDSMAPLPVRRAALSTAVTYPARGNVRRVVTFRDARAHFSENSSSATASFSICVMRPDVGPIGLRGGDLRGDCSRLRPVTAGARLDYSRGSDEYVVMTIHPTRPGTARVDQVELDYGLGWDGFQQHGTDTIAVDVTSHAR
jgi:hypothetical protein